MSAVEVALSRSGSFPSAVVPASGQPDATQVGLDACPQDDRQSIGARLVWPARTEMDGLKYAAQVRSRCAWWLSSQCAGNSDCWCRPPVAILGPEPIPQPQGTTR
jgi:hypothetical protein